MAVNIIFYSTTSDRRDLNKVLSGPSVTYSGTFRYPVDVMHPTILINDSNDTFHTVYNYCYIASLGRYYYVDNYVIEADKLFRVELSVDVLMTYKGRGRTGSELHGSGILGLNAYVTRVAGGYPELNLVDTVFPITADPTITKITGTQKTPTSTWRGSNYLDTAEPVGQDHRFVLMFQGQIIGRYTSTAISQRWPTAALAMTKGEYALLRDVINGTALDSGHPFVEFIYDNYCLPVPVSGSNSPVPGYLDVPGFLNQIQLPRDTGDQDLTYQWCVGLAPIDVVWEFAYTCSTTYTHTNFAPYRRMSLTFLPFGKFELDPALIYPSLASAKMYVRCRLDPLTGNAALYYGSSQTNTPHYLGSSNVKIKLPMAASSYNVTKIAAGALTTAASVASMVVTGGASAPAVLGASAGVVTAFSGAASPNATVTGGEQIIIDESPVLQIYDYAASVLADNDMFGRPYCTFSDLEDLHGYCEVGRVHVSGTGFGNITAEEAAEIERHLKEGVILP